MGKIRQRAGSSSGAPATGAGSRVSGSGSGRGASRRSAGGGGSSGSTPAGEHTEHEDYPWEINIPDHPGRTDSPEYVKSRAAMNKMAASVSGLMYGPPPYQDHHGGGLWLKDQSGWFLVRNLAGMEWSSQFCADPAKVDILRQNAQRLYALCPGAAKELGIEQLLTKEIKTADDVATWTDSICNASVPLPAAKHTGVLPQGGGVHHYPAPIEEIDFFKRSDFNLWVVDGQGNATAVVPVAPPGSGKSSVRVVYSTPGSDLSKLHRQSQLAGEPLVFGGDHMLAKQAFMRQGAPARAPQRARAASTTGRARSA